MAAFTPTANQLEWFARSAAILDAKRIPRHSGPLYTEDDAKVALRSGPETARRVFVLWAIALRADGMPQSQALKMLDDWGLWPDVSPKEERYIRHTRPDPGETASFVWRLEAIWALMWAVGRIDQLGWPASMGDVPYLVEVMKPVEADPQFIDTTQLRSNREVLDAQDITMRLHWTIRDAWLNGRQIRSDLDWSVGKPDVDVTQSAAVGVIEERHRVFNWLTRFGDADWDHVDTPT